MTAEQIDQMPAGREMDELIAEKIFGWKHFSDDLWDRMRAWLIQRREFNWSEQTPKEHMPRMMITPSGENAWPPYYSSRIENAWIVRDELRAKGIVTTLNNAGFGIERCYGRHLENGRDDSIPHWDGYGREGESALAICRMALKTTL